MTAPLPPLTIIGHRGARGLAPENTLAGIETALRLGVDGVEFDVQRHPDGGLFLLHDLTLERTTNGQGLAAAQPFQVFSSMLIRARRSIRSSASCSVGTRSPCPASSRRRVSKGCAAAVAEVIRAQMAQGWDAAQFIVSSFHLPELQRFCSALPEVPVAALYCGVPLAGAAELATLGAAQVHLADEFVDADYVAATAQNGRPAWAYTVNTPEAARRLTTLGITGIFTDHPERFLRPVATAPVQ